MEDIIQRIKKLLALGQANSGATENEAATAMSMAAALMTKHGIQVDLDAEGDAPGAVQGGMNACDEDWELQVANASGYLYSCRVVRYRLGWTKVAFVGRPDNIQACEMTYQFLRGEVERLYKLNLPRGMTQSDRANFRRTFKFSCARRIAARAWAIMETLRQDDVKAIEATGSRALVVVQSIDAQLAEADAILSNMNVKTMVVRPRAVGLGTLEGRKAGDTVQLQKQVGK